MEMSFLGCVCVNGDSAIMYNSDIDSIKPHEYESEDSPKFLRWPNDDEHLRIRLTNSGLDGIGLDVQQSYVSFL